MDFIIITSSQPIQAEYWRHRIAQKKDLNIPSQAVIIGVCENWPNRAGNGLGTLYAFDKARKWSKRYLNRDIFEEMRNGSSVAIYHMAGEGRRLFPLTGVEWNNKSAVLLPSKNSMTILEAVIKQSMNLSEYSKGRLSVFLGDQIFFPQHEFQSTSSHITVMCQKRNFPSEKEWKSQIWKRYGIISNNRHFDKIDYSMAQTYAKDNLSLSLGAFTLSAEMTGALLEEFMEELLYKNAKMDIEPFLFMPLTLSKDIYLTLMNARGQNEDTSKKHFDRTRKLHERFGELCYSIEDIGSLGKWWDFGNIKSYYQILLNLSKEPLLLKFLLLDKTKNKKTASLEVDSDSILIDCRIKAGKIKSSVLCRVVSEYVDVDHVLAMNVCAPEIIGKKSLIYKAVSTDSIQLPPNTIRADYFHPETLEHVIIHSNFDVDQKIEWNKRLFNNKYSFAELQKLNEFIFTDDVNSLRNFSIQEYF